MLDLVIRNAQIADGSGGPLFSGDVGVKDGFIVSVGNVSEKGRREIEATGLLLTPGFVDIHTHYDGQAIWSDRLAPSSDHGVTSVVTGNCGIGFAPCRKEDHAALISMMESVEDIPEAVATAGLSWDWETFPEFLDAIERREHDIDVATLLPHSPLRAYAMGERGIAREAATDADLSRMKELARDALKAGALGFGTSRLTVHRTASGDPIPTFDAAEQELLAIADVMRIEGSGMFQIVTNAGFVDSDKEFALMERIAARAERPVTYTQGQRADIDHTYGKLARANDKGLNIKAQYFPRPIGMIVGIETSVHPFSLCPSYQTHRGKSRSEIVAAMRDPDLRSRLINEQPFDEKNPVFLMARNFKAMFPIGQTVDYEPDRAMSIAARAEQEGRRPEEVCYDLLLEDDGRQLLMIALANYADYNLDHVEKALRNENVVMGLGDGGAHYGLICDASYTTFALTHWTRDRAEGRFPIEQIVHLLARKPAELVGLYDRGLIETGYRAHLNLIDYDRLQLHPPELVHDLPGGGRRLHQRADGYVATIVSGEVIAENGHPTPARPGKLVRGAQHPRSSH